MRTFKLVVICVLAIAVTAFTDVPTAHATTNGYRLLAGDGGVFTYGATFYGSAASSPTRCAVNNTDRYLPNGTCWSMATNPTHDGYWILNADTNRIYGYGNAPSYGQPADKYIGVSREFVPTGIAIIATPTGKGYWVLELPLSGAAQIQTYGDAVFYGDTHAMDLKGSPVGFAATADGKGYWIVYSDGGVFAFGNATFHGSMGARHLNQPVVGISATPDGGGYWLVARDGGVFAFGNARFAGSMANKRLNGKMVSIAADPSGNGYWTAASDGGVFAFGGAPFLGSMGNRHLNRPIFAISAG